MKLFRDVSFENVENCWLSAKQILQKRKYSRYFQLYEINAEKCTAYTQRCQYILILNCRFQLKLSTFKHTRQTSIAWYFFFKRIIYDAVYAILIRTHYNLKWIHWFVVYGGSVMFKKKKNNIYLFLLADNNLTFHDTFHALFWYYAANSYTKTRKNLDSLSYFIRSFFNSFV